jgi:hypothetical protein
MTDSQDIPTPTWFPDNPYTTHKEWSRKSLREQTYFEAMDDILKAYLAYEKMKLNKD